MLLKYISDMKPDVPTAVPLVSRMCPSDTYRVFKSGSNVRIDTTLIGFDQTSWQRGNRSYIFKGQGMLLSDLMFPFALFLFSSNLSCVLMHLCILISWL